MDSNRPLIVIPSLEFTATVERLEATLLILTNLLEKYDQHSDADVKDVTIFLLREVSEVHFRLTR